MKDLTAEPQYLGLDFADCLEYCREQKSALSISGNSCCSLDHLYFWDTRSSAKDCYLSTATELEYKSSIDSDSYLLRYYGVILEEHFEGSSPKTVREILSVLGDDLIAEKVIQEMMGIIRSLYRETQEKETDAQYVIEECDDIT